MWFILPEPRFLFENRGHKSVGHFTVSHKVDSKEITLVMGSGTPPPHPPLYSGTGLPDGRDCLFQSCAV